MYAQKKSIDNTHIVREKDRQRNRELLAVLSLGVPIGFFLLVFAWQNLEVIRLGREATQLQKTLKEQETAHKQLQAELDRLTSFDAVETQASRLGFVPAPPASIVMVEPRAGAAPTPSARVAPAHVAPPTGAPAASAGFEDRTAVAALEASRITPGEQR
jgi:cell division protein FtsB